MKNRCLFYVVTCTIVSALSVGCNKPVSSTIAVQEDQQTASVYADKGGTLTWEDTDTNPVGFQVSFPYSDSPCLEGSPITPRPNETEVVCHVVQSSGTYVYQVSPLNARGAPGLTNGGVNNLAQVGNCKNCKGTGKAGGQQQYVGQASVTPDHLAYIGCVNNTKAKDFPSQPPFIVGQTLEWTFLGSTAPQSYGATFNNKNPDGSPVTVPPCKEGFGPFFGLNQMCTLADNAAGQTYQYTVARNDCGNGAPSDPTTITVQAKQ